MLMITLAVALVSGGTDTRCSVGTLRTNPEGYFWPLHNIERFMADADVIVRARAERASFSRERGAGSTQATDIEFNILETIKGEAPVDLRIPGRFVKEDDFNNGPVPYRIVRPSGQRGSCSTDEYRQGAEYLLILRRAPNAIPLLSHSDSLSLTPYWAALAPLNEQVRGADDKWVLWVRRQVDARDAGGA